MTDADQGHTPAPMISAPPSAPPPAISFEDLVRSINAATPRPFVAPTLVALNLLVFVIMVAMGVSPTEPTTASLVEWGANFGVKTVHGEWWRLVSHQFLHAGWLHLAINLYALLSFGLLFERLAGNVGFLMVYLVAGLSGGITRLYWDPYLVSVGASGSIFGIAGATMGFVFLRRDSLPANVRDKILKDVLVFLALNAFYGLKAEGIDHAAHVGGCLSGVICGMVLSQPLPLRTERRKGRNLVVAGLGVSTVLLTMLSPPQAISIDGDVSYVLQAETEAIERTTSLLDDLQNGRISEPRYADAIEKEVLPPWNEARKWLSKLVGAPYGNKELFRKLLNYFQLRQEAYELQIRAIREMSEALGRQSRAKWDAAEAAAKELSDARQ